MRNDKYHQSVLINEVLRYMPNGKVIDCTLGTGGHTLALSESGRQVLSIEMDPKMLKIAQERVQDKAILVQGNFSNLDKIAKENGFLQVSGVLFDLGVSNLHLKEDDRGFSFTQRDQELDMRLNPDVQGVRALDLLNALNKGQLTEMFLRVMKYPQAKRMALKVLEGRPFKTVGDLKDASFGIAKKESLDSATLPMLALRIAVNSEYENIIEALPKAYDLLEKGGKLLVITFHSGEENIVERVMKGPGFVVKPTSDEVFDNPRSRSAKLHIYEKK